jgi:hypothetical protein
MMAMLISLFSALLESTSAILLLQPKYYSQPSSSLVIPPVTIIIPLELLRGFIYAVVLLVVFAGIKSGRRLNFVVASTLLYIPGAFLPLISSMVSLSFIYAVAPFHMVEIFADSVVYGYAASRLISAKSA